MKVAHVSIYPPKGKRHAEAGGVASYTKNLLTTIALQNNAQNYILCNKLNGVSESYLEDGIEVVRCFDRSPRFLWQIFRQIRAINPTTIHIQQELGLYGNILTAYLLQWLVFLIRRRNIIITLHGIVSLHSITDDFIKENNSRLPPWLVKIAFMIIFTPLCKWSSHIIVHEERFKTLLMQEYGVAGKKVSVIPHGIENFETMSKEEACTRLTLNPARNIVLFMGYLTGYKGIELLINGFSKYVKENPNAYLIIGAGEHPKLKQDRSYIAEYNQLQNTAARLIPATNYRWVGFINENDISSYYSAADVSVYPYTIQMASSGPMDIAIGHGKPFICSDVFETFLRYRDLIFQRTEEDFMLRLKSFFERQNASLRTAIRLKRERLWDVVGTKTMNVYQKT